MLTDDLRAAFLTSGLTDQQLAEMVDAGEEVPFSTNTELFREGEPANHLWVLLDGRVELTRRSGNDTAVLMTMSTPGQWAGGLRAWGDATSSAGYRATGRAVSDGRIFRLPSEDLGRLVGEWFPFGKHMTAGLYQTILGIEATARQRESLVALGTLAAGLAHEINNPAASSLRAVDELRATCDAMLSSLTNLASRTITSEQFTALDRLRRELAERPAPDAGAVATMDREAIVAEWLERRQVEHSWELTAPFASVGADQQWLEAVESVVGPAALNPALRWAASTITATALLAELTHSTNRISSLVAAATSYTQMDRASMQHADVRQGIADTLVMLGSKLADVEVHFDRDKELPSIDAFHAELNQVWTNLIDNAIDAMDGVGTLRVAARRDGDNIVVDFTDSGHGMDAAVRDRAFEPFFTTKDVGKGTGLGLDISRRIIVERHGGAITFDSKPGETTARVRLPITR